MEYIRRKRISHIFAMPVSIVLPNMGQSSFRNMPTQSTQSAPTISLLKYEYFKSRQKLSKDYRNSQILNPLTL
ncbi:hypothetical protein LOAG_12492 [Loa loa]|uniref:Uncharacterized protein n=1 Tax=Loa loa TaxID=7209 RepID=A0A1S0TL75_LOALO|nr:hypothetical protein LOAG_12492 [Loa loa]EFO16015.1 hypothetical protein LOAG_12492 [Loa loa]